MNFPTIIKNSHWSDLLLFFGPCSEKQYQFSLSTTYQQFWETCPRGEWLLHWIAKEGSTPHKLIVHATCQCARLALPYCTDKKQRPLKCIETTEKWIRGEATLKEVKQAGKDAHAVYSDAYSAVYAASATSRYAAAPFSAHADVAYYVASTAYHAAPKNKEATQKSMQLQTADLIRSLIPRPDKMVEEYDRILKLKAFL